MVVKRTKAVVETEEVVLTSVAFVAEHAPVRLSPLPHIVSCVNSFLDRLTSKWTLESAAQQGLVELLERLAAREWPLVGEDFRSVRFINGVHRAARAGDLKVLEWWLTQYQRDSSRLDAALASVLQIALREGHLPIIKWLHAQDKLAMLMRLPVVSAPLACYHAELVYWLHDQALEYRLELSMDHAARTNDFEFMQWILAHRDEYRVVWTAEATEHAARHHRMDMLLWLQAQRPDECSIWAVSAAGVNGHLDIIEWLYEQYPNVEFLEPRLQAVTNGHLDVVKWVVWQFRWRREQDRALWISNAIYSAAHAGNVEMVQYLFNYRSPDRSCAAVDGAALSGHLELLQWLHVNGGEFTSRAMDIAAAFGHLEIVQWLHENRSEGCSTHAMDSAAYSNHLDVVQWLHRKRSEGCTTQAMVYAAANGHLNVLMWLHQNRHEGCTSAAMDQAASKGHLDIVKYLHAHRPEGCTTRAMDQAATNGHMEIVEWLYDNRYEGCTKESVNRAVANGHLKIVAFLVLNYHIMCTSRGIKEAGEQGFFNVLEWLWRYDPDHFQAIQLSMVVRKNALDY